MIITTTPSVDGKQIKNYLGIVSGTTYVNTYATKNMSFKDMFNQSKLKESAKKPWRRLKKMPFKN